MIRHHWSCPGTDGTCTVISSVNWPRAECVPLSMSCTPSVHYPVISYRAGEGNGHGHVATIVRSLELPALWQTTPFCARGEAGRERGRALRGFATQGGGLHLSGHEEGLRPADH